MPNIKSAIKRTRINARKSAANKRQKSKIRTLLKKTSSAVVSSADNAEALVRQSQTVLDQAASKGLLHKNNVARQKSRLTKQLNASAQ